VAEFPRRLTSDERAVLDFLLSSDFRGAERLREQAKDAVVIARCDCGCPTFDLGTDENAESADLADVVPVEARAADGEGPDLLLFANDGRLQSVELVWYGDIPPSEFPPLETFSPPQARG
jgi:hypothetical protein